MNVEVANFFPVVVLPAMRPLLAPDPQLSTPENPRIWPIKCLLMFTEVINVGMKPKSRIFSHVSTAPAAEKAGGGPIWAAGISEMLGSAVVWPAWSRHYVDHEL